MQAQARLKICLIGTFRVFSADNVEYAPNGRKACALLAMLALSPGKRRARKWLQDKLWSDRGDEQAAASLRQCLTEIRRAFGEHKSVLKTDNSTVQLEEPLVQVDIDLIDPRRSGPAHYLRQELLEGLDVRDPEFEDWLREQRSWFEAEFHDDSRMVDQVCAADTGSERVENRQNVLILKNGIRQDAPARMLIADCIVDTVAKTMSEIGSIQVIDERDDAGSQSDARTSDPQHRPAGPVLELKSDIVSDDLASTIRMQLFQKRDGRTVWSNSLQVDRAAQLSLDDSSILGHLNDVVYAAIEELLTLHRDSGDPPIAATLCYNAIQYFFRLGKANLEVADKLFEHAYAVEPKGVYLAWRAYLRTFQLAERQFSCRETVVDEAKYFIRHALEVDRLNSFVQAIAAQVQLIVHRSYIAAYEFAEQSVNLNRANPLAWGLLGIAECNLGRADEGLAHTLRARQIAGTAPFRFHLDGMCCIAATVAGRFDQAIIHGEASHALATNYAPPIRYLSALYRIYDDERKSHLYIEKMRQFEPDFSYEKLRDRSYPAASMRRSKLFEALSTA